VAAALLRAFAATILAVLGALRAILTRAAVHRCLAGLGVLLAAARVLASAARHIFRGVLVLVLPVVAASARVLVLPLRSIGCRRSRLLRRQGQPRRQRENPHHCNRASFHFFTLFLCGSFVIGKQWEARPTRT